MALVLTTLPLHPLPVLGEDTRSERNGIVLFSPSHRFLFFPIQVPNKSDYIYEKNSGGHPTSSGKGTELKSPQELRFILPQETQQ